VSPDTLARERRAGNGAFYGDTVWVYLVATITWLGAVPVMVWRWRRGSRWYGLVPVGWLFVFVLATEWGRPSELFSPW
jgi:hypothetical protein